MEQCKMDRAAKVREYRKKRRGNHGSRSSQLRQKKRLHLSEAGIAGFGILSAGILAALFLLFYQKKEDVGLAYVTKGEFASLMSFLMEDLPGEWQKDPDAAVTKSQLKDFVQNIGLSEVITVTGGNDRMERMAVMACYEQILDYMDLDESVQKKTILLLGREGTVLQTQDGALNLKAGSLTLEPYHTYQAYLTDSTVLGIQSESEKTIAVRNVPVQSASDGKIVFSYQDHDYEIPCGDTEDFRSAASCTLCIKGGRVTKVKNIKASKAEAKQTAEQKLPETIRVLILNAGEVHYDQIYLNCDGNCEVTQNKQKKQYKASEVISLKKFKLKKGKSITVSPKASENRLFLTDKDGSRVSKGYYGSMTIYRDSQGYYIVNKVQVEKYLYSVVASEMPASFGTEALKAQAVCARSYVYRQAASNDYSNYHAQIDDSTNYQVYNKSDISEEDIRAVEATAGEIMYANGEIVNAYYFSSSHGYTSTMEIWNQDEEDYPYLKAKSLSTSGKSGNVPDLSDEKVFKEYITSGQTDAYDSSSRYFRWQAKAEPSACLDELKEKILQRQKINPNNFIFYSTTGKKAKKINSLKGFGGVEKMYCSGRGKSGAVTELTIRFEFGKAVIKSEYNIRSIIGCVMEQITYADGTTDTSARFLPSAYFTVGFNKKTGRYLLTGGGNGHGMGMSQYGAAGMAGAGWNYKEILQFFYDGAEIKKG